MADDHEYWESEAAMDQQAVNDQEIAMKGEWQSLKELESRLNSQKRKAIDNFDEWRAADYHKLGLYPAGNLNEYEQKSKEIFEKEEQEFKRAEKEERDGDKLAAQLESGNPEVNQDLCKLRADLRLSESIRNRKEKLISIQPFHSGMLETILFNLQCHFFTVFII